ncbi:MAG: hypothetical protein ABGY24_16585 [bacterium]
MRDDDDDGKEEEREEEGAEEGEGEEGDPAAHLSKYVSQAYAA